MMPCSMSRKHLLPLIVLLVTCSPVMAADDETPQDARFVGYPSGHAQPEDTSTALTWFALIGLGVLCLGPMFLNARRTHLD